MVGDGGIPEEARQVRHQLIVALNSAKQPLDQSVANHELLVMDSQRRQDVSFSEEETVSALGLQWHARGYFQLFKFQNTFLIASENLVQGYC